MTTTRYERGARIGQGGMADVWRSHRVLADGSRQDVAIKVVQNHLRQDQEIKQRFRQEAALTMGFHHKNVIKTYDLDRHDGQEIMVMEDVDGPSLGALTQLVTVPIPVLRYVFISAAEGLEHIHEHGVIHRDVSPGNILLSCAGDVRVVDLGLAKVTGTPKSDGYFKGTPTYASYEALCCKDVNESSDLYSLAAVFYEILTGKAPYGTGQYPQLRHRHQVRTIEPLPPDCPEDFREILTALLKPPNLRAIGSVRELWPRWEKFDDPLASRHQVAVFIRQVMDGDCRDVQANEPRVSISVDVAGDAAVADEHDDAGSDEGQGEEALHKTLKIDVVDALLDSEQQAPDVARLPSRLAPVALSPGECDPSQQLDGASRHSPAAEDDEAEDMRRAPEGLQAAEAGKLAGTTRVGRLVAVLALLAGISAGGYIWGLQTSDVMEARSTPKNSAGERIIEPDAPAVSEDNVEHGIALAPAVVADNVEHCNALESPRPGDAADGSAAKAKDADGHARRDTPRRSTSKARNRLRRSQPRLVAMPERDVPARFAVKEEPPVESR